MRPEESKHEQKDTELTDLPTQNSTDASKDADKVKGGDGTVAPRDVATGQASGKRL